MQAIDSIVKFGLLQKFPVKQGFSWGREALNMSEDYDDHNLIKKRVSEFLNKLNIDRDKAQVKINPSKNPFNDTDILNLDEKILQRKIKSNELEVGANSIFTKSKNLTLMIKPADCLICAWYGKNNKGEEYVGLIHCSAVETDKLIVENTFKILIKDYDFDPTSFFLGLTPAISKEYYFVKEGKINEKNWAGFLKKDKDKYFLDILGNVRNQLSNVGIKFENVEYYDVDTFSSAAEGETFSHRLSSTTDIPEGRFIVAIALN